MVKAGLLPLYIELYDESTPEARPRLERFYGKVADMLESQGIGVIKSPFCRLRDEFANAVSLFERRGADCIITLHMAYSPSLMSSEALAGTGLPVISLDVTETYGFGFDQDMGEVMYNHGIHGVMDMCNLLKRNGKPYAVAAGHYEKSGAVARAADFARAAAAAGALKGMKVGRVGRAFEGMGDFFVEDETLKRDFEIEVVQFDPKTASGYFDIPESAVEEEEKADREAFVFADVPGTANKETIKACLGVRKWIEAKRLGAFTVNFLSVRAGGVPGVMPFMEACKAMGRGIGYAGEGDVLTAAFTGALLKGFPETSFVEIFCPDWEGGSLYLSHMGEMNLALAASKPVVRVAGFPYTDAPDPAAAYANFKAGMAVCANIAPMAEGYALVLAPVEMAAPDGCALPDRINGWMRPEMPVGVFLEKLSLYGATHHSMLVYGDVLEALEFFGKILNLKVIII